MKHTITIGIPAYNEEQNIGILLSSILKQKLRSAVLKKIIVSSDGSSDKTVEICTSVRDPRITVVDNKDRRGQAYRQNQIIEMTDTDELVLLNADIVISDPEFLEKLSEQIIDGSADLVSSNMGCMPARGAVGKILTAVYKARNDAYFEYRDGNNIYTCRGAARAMSREFYTIFRFSSAVAEDASSYLYCKKHNFAYRIARKAVVYIRWPENIHDHVAQSVRFFHSRQVLIEKYGEKMLTEEYRLPRSLQIRKAGKLLISQPLTALAYTAILLYSSLIAKVKKPSDTWVISASSKRVV